MVASDIDGTLLDYDYIPGAAPAVNTALLTALMAAGHKRIALVTNQGGLPFGVMGVRQRDGRRYPRPDDFILRLNTLFGAMAKYRLVPATLQVCVYHPRADGEAINSSATQLADGIAKAFAHFAVHTGEAYRKPSPAMLRLAGASVLYGDSDDDEGAAQAAGIPFMRVERFFGPKEGI